MKYLTRAALALSVFGLVGSAALPSLAADTCADKMKSVTDAIDASEDAAKKKAANDHVKMAQDAQKANDEKGCMDHLGMAESSLK